MTTRAFDIENDSIGKVAVLGAGVMGQGIAAHLANAGIPSVLFDMVPRDLPAGAPRSGLALAGITAMKKSRPALLYTKAHVGLITAANYDDDGGLLAGCDLIIEVVVERLDIKQKVFAWVAEHRSEGSIVTSNTSGIPLAAMAAGMSDEMAAHFAITHFFNPVRYMRLLEIVSGEKTLPAVTAALGTFGQRVLGKGIVTGKDTPNFVANRIGCYGMVSVFRHMDRLGLPIEAVDAVFGKPMGRPKSAVFRTADLVGLDTLVHVFGNVYDGAPDDEERDAFVAPDWLTRMVAEGALGSKAGYGFYKKSKDAAGKRVILARDLATGEYRAKQKARFKCIGKARNYDDPRQSVPIMIRGDDPAAQLAWAATADTLLYSARRIPEIADDVVNVDRAMRWGFGWALGPFETWDAIGLRSSVERMRAEGRDIPAWIDAMLNAGRETFYARDESGAATYWDPSSRAAVAVEKSDDWLLLIDVKSEGDRVVDSNASADLIDLGDGVLGLEFHSKMNAIDADIATLYQKGLDELDAGNWQAMVVGNQGGTAFCAGANLMMVGMLAMQGEWDQLGEMIAGLQNLLQRAKYSKRPVVVAPYGMTLGGGAEIAMQCTHTQANGELYMGLVEVGVGVIPAAGGCKELLSRALGDIPVDVAYDPNPFVQAIFKRVGMAKVATSAEEARTWGYLRPTDGVTLDPDAQLGAAKRIALGLAAAGAAPPAQRKFKLPGPSGRAAIELALYGMHEGGFATDHDMVVGKQLARVLTGGDIAGGTVVDEQHVLDLEREAFLHLCGTEGTQARIQHFLMTGKPLRN